MAFLKFRVDTDERLALHKDVETFLGRKVEAPAQLPDFPKTTNASSKLPFGYELDEKFLDDKPGWRKNL